jgi:hypothetical protein
MSKITLKTPGERVNELANKHVYTKLSVDAKTNKLKTSVVVLNGAVNEWSKEAGEPIYYVPALRVAGTQDMIRHYFKDSGLDRLLDLFLENAYTKQNYQSGQRQIYYTWNAPAAGSDEWEIVPNEDGTFGENYQYEVEKDKEYKKAANAIKDAENRHKVGLKNLSYIMKSLGLSTSVTGEDTGSAPSSPLQDEGVAVPVSSTKAAKKDALAAQFAKARAEGAYLDVSDVKSTGTGSHKVLPDKVGVKAKNTDLIKVFLGKKGNADGFDKVFFVYNTKTPPSEFLTTTSGPRNFLQWAGKSADQANELIVNQINAGSEPVPQFQISNKPTSPVVKPASPGNASLFNQRALGTGIKTTGLGLGLRNKN